MRSANLAGAYQSSRELNSFLAVKIVAALFPEGRFPPGKNDFPLRAINI